MEMKNKEIKNCSIMWRHIFDLFSLPSAMTEFMACDEAIEGEIAAIKAELTDANRRKDIYHSSADHLRNMALEKGDELRKANNKISELEEQLANAKQRLTLLENSRTGWCSRAQHAEKRVTDLNEKIEVREKEINDLKKKIHELEEENANLRVPPRDISKRPWHGDGNATTGGRTCCESLAEAIEFQNKKIEELEAEKARLKEAYDIHETTTKKENADLSPGHEFEFGDEVFVPWSCDPYMYIKRGMMYNPRTERLVYVGKDQDLKWFGEKFSIV